MTDFTQQYKDLIILQYADKPKASAEIDLFSQEFESIFDFMSAFETEFDLDIATGDRLDKIGKIVGIPRIVEEAIPKIFFGFLTAPNSGGFNSASFFDPDSPMFAATELDDEQMRFFIKAKIAKNAVHATMVSDNGDSIQDVIQYLFEGDAFVFDPQDMTLTLVFDPAYDQNKLILLQALDLLPKPMAVRYTFTVGGGFSFAGFPLGQGFNEGFFA